MTYLDTHVAVFLYAGDIALLSQTARDTVEAEELTISPFVLLELEFLYEIGRIRDSADAISTALQAQFDVRLCPAPLPGIVSAARLLSWTRDPFDRLIVGHATAQKGRLLTRDRRIHDHFPGAIW